MLLLCPNMANGETATRPNRSSQQSRPGERADARTLIAQALAAQGGEKMLRAIRSVSWIGTGYRNMVEQSERPEGPYLTEFQTITETDDYAGDRHRTVTAATVYPFGTTTSGIVAAGGVAMRLFEQTRSAGSAGQLKVAGERAALTPERLLLTAADADDVRREPDVVMQSVNQNVVMFNLDGAPVRIYLNAETHLPTAMDYSGPAARTNFWSFLGDATTRTYYGVWSLERRGIRYPLQLNVETNGLPDQLVAVHDLRFDGMIADADFTIPPDVRTAFAKVAAGPAVKPISLAAPQLIAPGVAFIPGAWNTIVIRQEDGIVVIEAPISNAYSAAVLAEAQALFPSLPIKAVVTTSDAWPHFAGIREYVAHAIPVYALDRNLPILGRNVDASYASKPDLEYKVRQAATFRSVSGMTVVGTGRNRMVLYPLRGETTERQMMVYFPELRLLYGSDAFQQDGHGEFTFPQAVDEVVDAATREHLAVDRVVMMHIAPEPWQNLLTTLSMAKR